MLSFLVSIVTTIVISNSMDVLQEFEAEIELIQHDVTKIEFIITHWNGEHAPNYWKVKIRDKQHKEIYHQILPSKMYYNHQHYAWNVIFEPFITIIHVIHPSEIDYCCFHLFDYSTQNKIYQNTFSLNPVKNTSNPFIDIKYKYHLIATLQRSMFDEQLYGAYDYDYKIVLVHHIPSSDHLECYVIDIDGINIINGKLWRLRIALFGRNSIYQIKQCIAEYQEIPIHSQTLIMHENLLGNVYKYRMNDDLAVLNDQFCFEYDDLGDPCYYAQVFDNRYHRLLPELAVNHQNKSKLKEEEILVIGNKMGDLIEFIIIKWNDDECPWKWKIISFDTDDNTQIFEIYPFRMNWDHIECKWNVYFLKTYLPIQILLNSKITYFQLFNSTNLIQKRFMVQFRDFNDIRIIAKVSSSKKRELFGKSVMSAIGLYDDDQIEMVRGRYDHDFILISIYTKITEDFGTNPIALNVRGIDEKNGNIIYLRIAAFGGNTLETIKDDIWIYTNNLSKDRLTKLFINPSDGTILKQCTLNDYKVIMNGSIPILIIPINGIEDEKWKYTEYVETHVVKMDIGSNPNEIPIAFTRHWKIRNATNDEIYLVSDYSNQQQMSIFTICIENIPVYLGCTINILIILMGIIVCFNKLWNITMKQSSGIICFVFIINCIFLLFSASIWMIVAYLIKL